MYARSFQGMCGWGGAGELPEEEGEAAPDPEDDIIPMAEDHFEVGSATDASYYLKYIKHDFRPWRKYGIPRVSSSLSLPCTLKGWPVPCTT